MARLSAALSLAAVASLVAAAGSTPGTRTTGPELTGGALPAWSPDGKKIVYANGSRLIVMSASNGRGKRALSPAVQVDRYNEIQWAPSQPIVLWGTFARKSRLGSSTVVSVDPRTGRGTLLSRASSFGALTPNGRTVAFVQIADFFTPSRLGLVSVGGGNKRLLPSSTGHSDYSPTFSPDGKRIAFVREACCNDVGPLPVPSVMVTSTAGGEARTFAVGALSPHWSPDGRWIAFCRGRLDPALSTLGCTELDIAPARGGKPRVLLTALRFESLSFSWSRDSSRLAFVRAGTLATIDLTGHRTDVRLGAIRPFDDDPGWSPDGTRIAFAARFGPPRSHKSGIYVVGADGRGLSRFA